jgi:hypothetical protein
MTDVEIATCAGKAQERFKPAMARWKEKLDAVECATHVVVVDAARNSRIVQEQWLTFSAVNQPQIKRE